MDDAIAQAPFTPPVPVPPEGEPSWWRLAAAFRTNALLAWPRRAYEERVTTRPFLGHRIFILNDPAAIRRLLVDDQAAFGRTLATVRVLRPLLGDGLFLSQGEAWRHQRRILAPAFTPRATALLARHIISATEEAVARLAASSGGPVDLQAAVQHLTLEIAGRSMFSLEMRQYGGVLRGLIARYSRQLGRPHFLDLVLPLGLLSPHDILRRRFTRDWMGLIAEIMGARQRATAAEGPRDLFDLMVEARDPETGATFGAEQLRDQIATMITAGHETTAVALFWALYLLAKAPAIQERVAAEAASVEPAAAVEDLPRRLPLTRAVVDEAIRLYPPAFTIVRAARSDTTIGDIAIKRGDVLMAAPWLLHRHRGLWRDPDSFDPRRFLPGAPPPDRFAYLPFGVGPRICIGAHFALTEATLVLAALVRAFRIGLPDDRPVLPVAVVTLQPDHAPGFRLERR